MKDSKKRIIDIIRADLITMNGDRSGLKVIIILSLAFFAVITFIFPFFAAGAPPYMGIFIFTMLSSNEVKYQSGKMYSLIPVSRKDIVSARFIMFIGIEIIIGVIFFLLMQLSGRIMINSGVVLFFNELNSLYFVAFSVGMMILSGQLRYYFRDSKRISLAAQTGGIRKSGKKEYIIAVLFVLFLILAFKNIIPVRPLLNFVMMLLLQLMDIENGIFLTIFFMTIGAFSVVYKYICTVLEYDEKEL